MPIKITFKGNTRFEITAGHHAVLTDQPLDDGGGDAGMSPVELFVGSLAGCVGYFIGRYCSRHNLAAEGLTVDADWSMAERPHRVGEIRLQVHGLSAPAHHRERLLKVAHGCTVHQSLLHPPKIEVLLDSTPSGPVHPKNSIAQPT